MRNPTYGVLALSLFLSACGGGGGGGGGGPVPIVYGGNTSAAIITPTNASKLTANVIGSNDTATIILGVSIESGDATQAVTSGALELALRLNRTFRDTVVRAEQARSTQRAVTAVIPVDVTEPCDGGGSTRTSGRLNDDGTGTLTISFNNCLIDGVTLDGSATLRVDVFDFGFPTDFTISFSRLTLRGSGLSMDAGGSLRAQLDFGTNTEAITANLVSQNNDTGEMTKAENLVFVNVYDNISFPTSFTANISGRVFDQVHGYVDVTTTTPFFFGTLSQLFPDSGQMLLTGVGNRSIRVTALSSTLTTLALDLDGNGVPENTATLKWTDLSGPVGSDLADDDSDGMHNSWETVNGLNPADPADAALDKDGDGASNLGEYQAGTGASDSGSTPPAVGLSISLSDSPDPVTVGGNLTYTLTVFNSNAVAANNVVVADTLPTGVDLVSAIATQGSCTGTSLVTCNLGTLNGFGNVVITIVVTPTAEGLVNNTASVTSNSFDPDMTNNSATSTTTVGQAVAGIQALIDDAPPGDTVLVGPGIYIGGLNFNGKNITLRSSAGPASTIIDGNQGTAVRIGPLGAIKGFTITGGDIEANDQGTLISGNIFNGNVQSSGGFGTAIGGNNASPTIERNIFRNNNCGDQSLSGVVVFVNSSSPLIVNNIFENNQCRGINLTLPAGNTPQVINNTFVGNRTAIRVDRRVPQVTQTYRNNIIVQNGIGLEIEFGTDPDNPVWGNNLVFGNTANYQGTANQTGASGNISVDPLFVNGAAGNYRVQSGSPAIDSGSALGAPGVDFDGTLRPLDGNGDATASVDMGAFEAPQIP